MLPPADFMYQKLSDSLKATQKICIAAGAGGKVYPENKGAGSFHDIRKTMKELSANDTSRYPKVLKSAPNHECQ